MMDRPRRWFPRWLDPVAFFGAAMVGLLTFGIISSNQHSDREAALRKQQADDLQCITNYVNASSDRTGVLTKLGNDRSNAQTRVDQALHAITKLSAAGKHVSAATGRRLVSALDSALAAYERADTAYKQAQVQYPLPPPIFTCSDRLKSRHSSLPTPAPSAVTYTAVTIAPRSTRTITVTVPRVELVPGPTRVVPGPTVVVRCHGKSC